MKSNKIFSYYFSKLVYQYIFIPLLQLFFIIAKYFSNKLNKGFYGRKNTFSLLKEKLALNNQPILWIHAASYGEYKQGLSIISEWRKQFSNYYIVISFFSPSGYEGAINETAANLIFYLPFDTQKNAQKLIEIIRPRLMIIIKYDVWPQLIFTLKQHQIPIYLVSAIIKPNHFYLKPLFSYFQYSLQVLNAIFVQNQETKNLLEKIGLCQNIYTLGDTRFDTMKITANTAWKDSKIEHFIHHSKVFIAGSIYPNDVLMLKPFIEKYTSYKFILVPHHLDEQNLFYIKQQLPQAVLYTELDEATSNNYHILILNTMGMLDKVYRYADLVYIGGGLDKTGIHNIVEPIAYQKITMIGSNYSEYKEAVDLVHLNAVQVVKNSNDIIKIIDFLQLNEQHYHEIKLISKKYFDQNCQVANKVVEIIKEKLSL